MAAPGISTFLSNLIRPALSHCDESSDELTKSALRQLQTVYIPGEQVQLDCNDGKFMTGEVVSADIHGLSPTKVLVVEPEGSPSSDKENGSTGSMRRRFEIVKPVKYSLKVSGKIVNAIPTQAIRRVDNKMIPSYIDLHNFIKSVKRSLPNKTRPQPVQRDAQKVSSVKRKLKSGSPTHPAPVSKKSKASTPVQKTTIDKFLKSPPKPANSNEPLVVTKLSPVKSSSENKSPAPKNQLPATKSKNSKAMKNGRTKKSTTNVKEKKVTQTKSSPAAKVSGNSDEVIMLNGDTEVKPCSISLAILDEGVFSNSPQTKNKTNTPQKVTEPKASNGPPSKTSKKAGDKSINPNKKQKTDEQVVVIPDTPKKTEKVCNSPQKTVYLVSQSKDGNQALVIVEKEAKGSTEKTMMNGIVSKAKNADDSKNSILKYTKKLGGSIDVEKVNTTDGKKKKAEKKQMTLFDCKIKSPEQTMERFMDSNFTPPTPKVIRKYRKAIKANDKLQSTYLLQAARELTDKQIAVLPDNIKTLITAKREFLQLREKFKNMTEEEKRVYMREKLKQRNVTSQRYSRKEDALLTSTPLPEPVTLLPSELSSLGIGDILYIIQFIHSYDKFFIGCPEHFKIGSISKDSMIAALLNKDRTYLNSIATFLLQSLLHDPTFNEASEMGVCLKDIPVTENTLSEILQCSFYQAGKKANRSENETNKLVQLSNCLSKEDFVNLSFMDQIDVLVNLCNLLLDTQGIINYHEDLHKELSHETKRRNKIIEELTEFETKCLQQNQPLEDELKELTAAVPSAVEEAETANDALQLRSRISRRSAEERQKKLELDRIVKEQSIERDRIIRLRDQTADKVKKLSGRIKLCLRLTSLGCDRYHRRYWLCKGVNGLVVEQGWATDTEMKKESEIVDLEKTEDSEEKIPPHCEQKWLVYETKDSVDDLIKSLNYLGFREYHLLRHIKEVYEKIHFTSTNEKSDATKKQKEEEKPADSLDVLKLELITLEDTVRTAGLGGIEDYDEWCRNVSKANEVPQLAGQLLECQSAVSKYRIAGPLQGRKSNKSDQSEGQINEPTNKKIDRWREEVLNSKTASRLAVLMSILDLSITWDKSIENAKCTICRLKGNESELLLCDQCNSGFHTKCIRLDVIPDGDWFCPVCKPEDQRRSNRVQTYKEEDDDEDEESDEESSVKNFPCEVCDNADGEMVTCDSCITSYHKNCLKPPLRAIPRFSWTCYKCRFGDNQSYVNEKSESKTNPKNTSSRNKKSPPTKRTSARNVRVESESDEEEITLKTSRTKRNSINSKRASDTDESPPGKQGRQTKNSKTRKNRQVQSSDEELEEVKSTKRGSSRINTVQHDTESDDEIVITPPRTTRNRKSQDEDLSDQSKNNKKNKGKGSKEIQKLERFFKVTPKELTPSQQIEACRTILRKVVACRFSWPFDVPVDKTEVPDYYKVIKSPIDLQTIGNKLDEDQYEGGEQFMKDFTLLFFNSYDYNQRGDKITELTVKLENYFQTLVSRHLPNLTYETQQHVFNIQQ